MSTMETFTYKPATCKTPVCDPQTSSSCICPPISYKAFDFIETFCIALFTIEYLLRIFTVPFIPFRVLDSRYFFTQLGGREPKVLNIYDTVKVSLSKVWLYATKTLNLIDLLAVAPYYVTLFTDAEGLGFLRVLRLARVLRIFKLGKYSEGGNLFYNTLTKSAPALTLMLFFITIMMIIFGSLIFFFEQGNFQVTAEYPGGAYYRPTINGLETELSPFHSIPISFYWVVITTTTVGYGDFAPTTLLGRLIAVFASYIGIICVALPITIIGTNFTNEYERMYGSAKSGSLSMHESANTSSIVTSNNILNNESSLNGKEKVLPIYDVDLDTLSVPGGNPPDGAGLVRLPSIIRPDIMLEEPKAHSQRSILKGEEVLGTDHLTKDVDSNSKALHVIDSDNENDTSLSFEERKAKQKLIIFKELEALEMTVNTLKKKMQSLLED